MSGRDAGRQSVKLHAALIKSNFPRTFIRAVHIGEPKLGGKKRKERNTGEFFFFFYVGKQPSVRREAEHRRE